VDLKQQLLGTVQEVLALLCSRENIQLWPYSLHRIASMCPNGFVVQVIQPQEALAGTCPLLRIQLQTASADNIQLCEQHLIPWVSTIVQRIHSQSRTITIAPPAGLLELGRQQVLLDQLRPELIAYGEAAPDSMAARLGQHYMPTKRQLADAGREDLIKRVISAGGFIHVAHLLGLRAKRKPEGQFACFATSTWR